MPVDSGRNSERLTIAECREKAAAARCGSAACTDDRSRLEWSDIADQWTILADGSERQDEWRMRVGIDVTHANKP
jgi:hypothetical protein